MGLLSMEHYAAQAGLDLSIDSNRKTGTIVKAAARGGPIGKAKRDLCRST